MSMQDPITDMLTRIRNAQGRRGIGDYAGIKIKQTSASSFRTRLYRGLRVRAKPEMTVKLKYHQGQPVIEEISA